MADLNDDIKKYLRGELSPAEMHALEKKALNDPFLEDALEGAGQLDSNSFDSDLKNLRSSLEERITQKSRETVSVWVWPARIAAGLILVALSTFVIVKLTGNKTANDLALKQESSRSAKDNADEEVASDSAILSRDVTTQSQAGPAEPQPSTSEQYEKDSERAESKPGQPKTEGDAVLPDIAANSEDRTQAEKTKANEQIAVATEAVPEDSTVIVRSEAEQETVASKKIDTEGAVRRQLDADDKRRVAAKSPVSAAQGFSSGVINTRVIKGRVVSADGIGLPGVNVMFKNTNIGTVTDGSGNYQISVADNNPSLVFSFIGFTSEEVAVGDKSQVDVRMSEDVSQLSEIVVVGNIADRKTDDEIPETLELANPYGGRRAYKQYLEKNINYPEQALANNIEGKVTIQFTVESSGQLSNFTVIKGIGHGCDEEVIRLVKQGPKWNPTRRNTESLRDRVKVRMKFSLPKK